MVGGSGAPHPRPRLIGIIFLTGPDGAHVVIIEGSKSLTIYCVDKLSSPVMKFPLFGEIVSCNMAGNSMHLVARFPGRTWSCLFMDVRKPTPYERVLVSGPITHGNG